MKKKLIVLAATALFSVGLAFYTNNSKTMNVLSDSNVEALTGSNSGDVPGGTYQVFGDYPTRIIVDNITHVVTFEGKKQAVNKKNKPINACSEETGGTCTINTTTTVYKLGVISSYLQSFFKGMSEAMPIINWIMSLFK